MNSQNEPTGEKDVEIEEARTLICFWMRQMSGGYYPTKIELTDELAKYADQPTAQGIYDQEIARIEAFSGPLPRWDSEKNAPVPGTPKP